MPVEVILPKVDMDMTHGTLAVWHVAEGETVTQGAALFDIETDKAAMEVEAPATGRLHAVSARPGDKVAVGTVVALIFAHGETAPTAPRPTPIPAPTLAATPSPTLAPTLAPNPAPTAAGATDSPAAVVAPARPAASDPAAAMAPAMAAPGGLRATPAARAAARQWGLQLPDIPGSGPLGRIQLGDVLARAQTPAAAAPAVWASEPGPLHVSHRPGGGAPLVLIHGFAADSQSWAPLERALGPDRALIRIDLPGHGRSPRRGLRGFADLARMVTDAIDGAAPGPVHLLGHSLGAALALATADIRPRRIASLALIAPAGLGPEIDAATLTGIVRASRVESLAPWLRRLTATPQGISDDYARAAMRLRTDPALRAAQSAMADALFPDGVQAFDLRPALARLQIPTCVIWGRQDRILPPAQAIAADGEFALHLLTGAGHVPHIECPDRVARIASRHLAAAEAQV